ncbi:NUDIX hydrolase [Carnimonas nigrificans]|uniref:NUDIX hydrolase n=1 Tax=Carnimonas nigrificans TaxID=64323 RepID=UPI00046E8B0C|nr:NUDIX domain-containing protein [Carnimonas nigrificans]
MPTTVINVVAGCLLDQQQRLLVVRKRNTQRFMLPGGKPDTGESPLTTLAREWQEELGVQPDGEIKLLGTFSAAAANEPNCQVTATIFCVEGMSAEAITCAAEIEEFRWLPIEHSATLPLAPLLETQVLPALKAAHGF